MTKVKSQTVHGYNTLTMNNYLSDKIKIISFFLIIIVMYEHCGFRNDDNGIEGMIFNQKIQKLFITILGRFAVPLFYMISGYLFFLNVNTLSDVFSKVKKRFRTLFIPYVIAAVVYTLILYLIFLIPNLNKFVNENPIENLIDNNLISNLYSIFLYNNDRYPFPFHLWFLRNLIFIIACSPALFFIVRKRLFAVSCTLFLFLLSNDKKISWDEIA